MSQLPVDFFNSLEEIIFEYLEEIGSEDSVSEVELDTLRRALAGQTAKEIAEESGISDHAVRKRLGSIYDKFPIDAPGQRKLEKLQDILLQRYHLYASEKRGFSTLQSNFYGRDKDLKNLENMINDDSKIITILGDGGVGKTSLAEKLISEIRFNYQDKATAKIRSKFGDRIIWYSLRTAPPVEETIKYLLDEVPGNAEDVNADNLQKTHELNAQIRRLISLLKEQRCLIILDNLESILSCGYKDNLSSGYYLEDYDKYKNLFTMIGEENHRSCLVLTSREKPRDIELLEIKSFSTKIKTLHLSGLKQEEALNIFGEGFTKEESNHLYKIINYFYGNPLSLKMIASTIEDTLGGKILEFKIPENENDEKFVIDKHVKDLIEEQVNRLSFTDRQIIYWLAIRREATSVFDLQSDTNTYMSILEISEILKSLQRRSLIEKQDANNKFILQPVIMEYITDRIIGEFFEGLSNLRKGKQEEIKFKKEISFNIVSTHSLIQTKTFKYIREFQTRFILQPVSTRIVNEQGNKEKATIFLKSLLKDLKQEAGSIFDNGYVCGNIINLLLQINNNAVDLENSDCSNQNIKRAYLQDAKLWNANFEDATFSECEFTRDVDSILSLAFNPTDPQKVAAGTADGKIILLDINKRSIRYFGIEKTKHKNWVRTVTFSPDGKILASGSDDYTIKLWDVETEELISTSKEEDGHTNWVCSIAYHPDGKFLASGGQDNLIKIWRIHNDGIHGTLLEFDQQIETKLVWSIAFSSDGKFLASGSDNPNSGVSLWKILSKNQQSITFEEHKIKSGEGNNNRVFALSFSPDNRVLASAGDDDVIKIWDMTSSEFQLICRLELKEKDKKSVRSICFSPDGEFLAVAGDDGEIKFYNIGNDGTWKNAQWVKNLTINYQDRIYAIAFPPSDNLVFQSESKKFVIACGADDKTFKLWRVNKNEKYSKCEWEFKGYTDGIWSIHFSNDGSFLWSSGDDHSINSWDANPIDMHPIYDNKKDSNVIRLNNQKEDNSRIWSFSMSNDGKRLASGDDDGNIEVWHVKNDGKLGKQIKVKSIGSQVWSVAFHPKNNNLIAIGDDNSNVILWDVEERSLKKLEGHSSRIWSVAFSPDGEILASASDDCSIKLWELTNGTCFDTLTRPISPSRVWCIVFSHDGKYLFSANDDGKIDMWVKNDDDSCEQKYTYKYKEDFEVEHSQHRLWSIAVNPSNTKLVSGSNDGTVRLWDIQTGSNIEIAKNHEDVPQHEGWVCTVAFSPDGNSIASGGKDSKICIFNLETKKLKCIKKLKPYAGMNIIGANGIDKSQISELVRLGAKDESIE